MTNNIVENNIEKNTFSELGKFVVFIFIFLISIYLVFFIYTNITINSLSIEEQAKIEDKFEELPNISMYKILETNPPKAVKILNKIIKTDKTFSDNKYPKIKLINIYSNIAFCAPDGNIYISKTLYTLLDKEEELAFVLAHELAHYNKKNHLSILRKDIYNSSLFTAITLDKDFSQRAIEILADRITIEDIHHSRVDEIKADTYAGEKLVELYGTVQGGINVLNKLDEDRKLSFSYISKHQQKDDRIKLLEGLKKQI